MGFSVTDSFESARGCGFRKAGGIYLVGGSAMRPCGQFPIPLLRCPTCDAGVKPSRGWTWIHLRPFVDAKQTICERNDCDTCAAAAPDGVAYKIDRVGLLWIGEKYYPTPRDFLDEGFEKGISRRVSGLPRDFILGETWVFFAHRKAMSRECQACDGKGFVAGKPDPQCDSLACVDCGGNCFVHLPAMFGAFKPERIEYIVADDDDDDKLQSLADRGFTLVRVHRVGDDSLEEGEDE